MIGFHGGAEKSGLHLALLRKKHLGCAQDERFSVMRCMLLSEGDYLKTNGNVSSACKRKLGRKEDN